MEYIESLRIFRSVVELKSFTRAADIHGLARPAVSRAIAGLEERIGCRLLNRTTRQVSLTEAAERFYEGCVRILDDLDVLEADVANQTREAGGVLRLVAHTTATVSRLVPLIAGFKRAHPKVTLDVTLTERPVDLVGDGFDLGIIVPYMLTSETTVVRLLERIPVVIVATPQYLQASSTPGDPSELANHLFVPMSPSIRRPAIGFRHWRGRTERAASFRCFVEQPRLQPGNGTAGFRNRCRAGRPCRERIGLGKARALLTGSQLVDDSVEIQLAYSNRTLLPAKVRAFIDYAAAFFETLATSR